MNSPFVAVLPDAAATRALGAAIAEVLEGGDAVLLFGELGAGKTTLTKGLVAALGGGEEVTSPTFTLVHLYETEPVVAHVDCWRLETPAEVAELALDELLDEGAVAVIEWGELAAGLFGRDALVVRLEVAEGDEPEPQRRAVLSAVGESFARRMRHLEMACRGGGLEVLGAEVANSGSRDGGRSRP